MKKAQLAREAQLEEGEYEAAVRREPHRALLPHRERTETRVPVDKQKYFPPSFFSSQQHIVRPASYSDGYIPRFLFLFSDTTLPCPRGSGARTRRNTPHAWNTGAQSSCRFGMSFKATATHKVLHVTLPVPWEDEGHGCAVTIVCDIRHVILNVVAGTGYERKYSVLYQARIKMVPQVHFTHKCIYKMAHGREDGDRDRTGLWSTWRPEIF